MKMNKKEEILKIFLVFGILLFVFPLISAEGTVCCQKLKTGAWCQDALIEECDLEAGNPAPTSCAQTSYCTAGTCIDTDAGTCMPNTPKLRCELEGGTWDPKAKSEIPMCQNGCCVVGEEVAFVSQTECKQLASDYGINSTFRSDVTSEATCYDLATPDVKGACVIDTGATRTCSITTKESCVATDGIFEEGVLCTADYLATDCSKTKNTVCGEDGRVYFLDSCNNIANVYDASKYSSTDSGWTAEMENYWIQIQEPDCGEGNIDCGNCNYVAGTMCRDYQEAGISRPDFGDLVCADLGCSYDTNNDGEKENYRHGESWCAKSEGIYYDEEAMTGIFVDPATGAFINPETKNALETLDYNVPGSRYYKLTCIDGEVIVDPCRDFRNEICVESTFPDSEYRLAQCTANNWRECAEKSTKSGCEDPQLDCKWIYGYRYDFQKLTTTESRNEEEQGSCVPLYAPGFDFWNPETDGLGLCAMGTVQEAAVYETSWTQKRDKFADQPTCLDSSDVGRDKFDAVGRCLDNCYAIPDYGRLGTTKVYDAELVEMAHNGMDVGGNFEDFCISDRRGYYCEGKTGQTGGQKVACAEEESKRKVYPLFWTHEEWLNSIRERARSLGDCGYKTNVFGEFGDGTLEIITATFDKLKQDMQTVKGDGAESEKIYINEERQEDFR